MTIWRDEKAGGLHPDTVAIDASEEFVPEGGEGVAVLICENVPDWVIRPDTGEKLRVKSKEQVNMTCPLCKEVVSAPVLRVEGDLGVLDCQNCKQFIWFGRG